MEGFYAIYYTGVGGFGHAVLVLRNGSIVGADAVGGSYDGIYSVSTSGQLQINVDLHTLPGTTLVTGQTNPQAFSQKIRADLPKNFDNGQPVPLQTPSGPINVIFKKLRSFP